MFNLSPATLLGLLAAFAVASVSAQPDMSVVFGPNDMIVVILGTILLTCLFGMARLFNWNLYGAGHLMSHGDHEKIDRLIGSYGCGFFKLGGGFLRGLIKFIGYAFFGFAASTFLLHVFEDAGGASLPPAPPGVFATWFTYIWLFAVAAILLDKMAADFHGENQWHLIAAIFSTLSFLLWVTDIVFIILEIVLATGATLQWETVMIVMAAVWVLVSVLFTIRYWLVVYRAGAMTGNKEGYVLMEMQEKSE